jgi:uncharacterized protein YndB with AHSA1/START domain
MIHIQITEIIPQPAEVVFAYLTDPGKIAEYTQIATVITPLAGEWDDNPRAHLAARGWGNLAMGAVQEITESNPGRRYATRTVEDHGWLVAFSAWDLAEGGGATRVTVRHDIQLYSWLRLLTPLVSSLVRETVADEMARLKEELESSTTTREEA